MAKQKAAAQSNGIPEAAIANGRSVARATKRTLAIGPISIQTKLYIAASSETIAFNEIHDACRGRLKRAGSYCPICVEVAALKDFKYQPVLAIEDDAVARADRERVIAELKKGDPLPPEIMPVPFVAAKKGDILIVTSRDLEILGDKKVKPTENQAIVEKEHIAKGYDIGNEEFVVITKDEIEGAKAMNDDLMMVEQFVPLAQVNPVYFQKSYYVEPDPASVQSFSLLRAAMVKKGVAAVAMLTAYQQERLIFVVPYGADGMLVHESFLPEEIRAIQFPQLAPVSKADEAVATEFVEAMSGDLDMTKYKDSYQANLKALIEAKKDGKAPAPIVQKKAPKAGGNLIEMLKAGIATANAKAKKAA